MIFYITYVIASTNREGAAQLKVNLRGGVFICINIHPSTANIRFPALPPVSLSISIKRGTLQPFPSPRDYRGADITLRGV